MPLWEVPPGGTKSAPICRGIHRGRAGVCARALKQPIPPTPTQTGQPTHNHPARHDQLSTSKTTHSTTPHARPTKPAHRTQTARNGRPHHNGSRQSQRLTASSLRHNAHSVLQRSKHRLSAHTVPAMRACTYVSQLISAHQHSSVLFTVVCVLFTQSVLLSHSVSTVVRFAAHRVVQCSQRLSNVCETASLEPLCVSQTAQTLRVLPTYPRRCPGAARTLTEGCSAQQLSMSSSTDASGSTRARRNARCREATGVSGGGRRV